MRPGRGARAVERRGWAFAPALSLHPAPVRSFFFLAGKKIRITLHPVSRLALHSEPNKRQQPLSRRVFRIIVTMMILTGWIALSNRCALATLATLHEGPQPKETHGCCHQPGGDSRHDHAPLPSTMQCCNGLHVSTPDSAKLAQPNQPLLAVLPLMWVFVFDAGAAVESHPCAFETAAPPGSLTFAELVLHRCLPALAPPLV